MSGSQPNGAAGALPEILLVEDNPDDEALTLRALRKSAITNPVHVVHDGVEALEYLLGEGSEHRRPPALVLLDIKLPKVDGLEVLRRLREDERTTFLNIVILTTSTADEDVASGYRLRANSYISKPVDFERFAAAVRTVGLYWLVLNEPSPAAAAQ